MSGDPSGWGGDDKGAPMIVVQQGAQTDDAPVPGTRRGTAILWMGVLLGGMFIAVVFLGLNYAGAMHARDSERTRAEDLAKQLTAAQDRNRDYASFHRLDQKYIDDLKGEISQLRRGRRPPPTPEPLQNDWGAGARNP